MPSKSRARGGGRGLGGREKFCKDSKRLPPTKPAAAAQASFAVSDCRFSVGTIAEVNGAFIAIAADGSTVDARGIASTPLDAALHHPQWQDGAGMVGAALDPSFHRASPPGGGKARGAQLAATLTKKEVSHE
jgi:hypothetical protein